jgi:hypothetical protein
MLCNLHSKQKVFQGVIQVLACTFGRGSPIVSMLPAVMPLENPTKNQTKYTSIARSMPSIPEHEHNTTRGRQHSCAMPVDTKNNTTQGARG